MSYYSSSKFTLISNLLTFHNLKKKNDSAGFSSLTLLNNTVIAGHTFICEISIFFFGIKRVNALSQLCFGETEQSRQKPVAVIQSGFKSNTLKMLV